MLPPPDHSASRHLPYQAGTSASPHEANKAKIEGWLAKPQVKPWPLLPGFLHKPGTELHDLTCSKSAHRRKNCELFPLPKPPECSLIHLLKTLTGLLLCVRHCLGSEETVVVTEKLFHVVPIATVLTQRLIICKASYCLSKRIHL